MNAWLTLSLAGVISATTMLCAQLAAAEPNDASSGYAEITAPDDADVAIVPRPDPRRAAEAYAIETVPDRAGRASTMQPGAPRVLASLPAGPPLTVEIRFDPHRPDNANRAGQIGAALERAGIAVHAIGPASVPVAGGVGFVFAEDAPEAAELARLLGGTLDHATQIRLDPRRTIEALPGTIMITLGSERGTS